MTAHGPQPEPILKVGDVLKHRKSAATARVCRVTSKTVMVMAATHFSVIPLTTLWSIFERPEEL